MRGSPRGGLAFPDAARFYVDLAAQYRGAGRADFGF